MGSSTIGRPSGYSDEIAAQICDRIANGESLRAITCEEGMPSKSMVFRWIVENPTFRDHYTQARESQMESMVDELIDLSDPADKDDMVAVQRNRLQVDTRKWVMSKLAPKKYGDNANVNITGEITLGIAESVSQARQRLLQAKSTPPTLEAQLDTDPEAGE